MAYVFQSLALYALTIKLFIFCMCLFQDLALYALAMKMFKNNSLCFPEPRTLRTNHQVVYILYVSISRPRTLRTSPYLGQIGSDQSDQSIYGIRRTGQTILSTYFMPSTQACVHARYVLACLGPYLI